MSEELLLEALRYFRHTGADAASLRGYVSGREQERGSARSDRQLLDELESAGRVFRVGKRWFLSRTQYDAARGPAYPPEWQPEDAWILLALLHCEPPATLVTLIPAADFINHAIPSREELFGALNRLHSGGLLRAARSGYTPTDRARELQKAVEERCGRGLLKQMHGLSRILDCPCCGVRLKAVRWRIPLSEQQWRDAVAAYQQLARR